jgi:RimJ/RimL family protein N-acetyltransferase
VSQPILTTERLVLTPVAATDLNDLLALWSDADFTRHIMGRALSGEEVWFRLLRDLGHWAALGYGNWSIRLNDGAYLGSVGVFDYRREMEPPFAHPELGWGVAPAFQGQGYAVEALRAALAWTDGHVASDATVCMISPENLASVRLAERVGYAPYAMADYKGSNVQLYRRPRGA